MTAENHADGIIFAFNGRKRRKNNLFFADIVVEKFKVFAGDLTDFSAVRQSKRVNAGGGRNSCAAVETAGFFCQRKSGLFSVGRGHDDLRGRIFLEFQEKGGVAESGIIINGKAAVFEFSGSVDGTSADKEGFSMKYLISLSTPNTILLIYFSLIIL